MKNTAVMNRVDTKVLVGKIITTVFLTFFAIVTLIPYYWMIISSFKPIGDYFSKTTTLFPANTTIENYVKLFVNTSFLRWVLNSFIISLFSTGLGIIISSLAGFTFAVYQFKFREFLFWIVLSSVAIPEIVTIIPVFKMIAHVRLIDTYSSLVLPNAVNMFGIFMMKQYVSSNLPTDLLESARIDGLSEWNIYLKIAMPLIKPGLGVLGIYIWINSWISYFWPLIMIKTNKMMTIPLGFATIYADPWDLQYGMLMAGSFLSSLPLILIFLAAQKQFIEGLTSGAVKG